MKPSTPETDKEIYQSRSTGMDVVNAGFARRLERERDQLFADTSKLINSQIALMRHCCRTWVRDGLSDDPEGHQRKRAAEVEVTEMWIKMLVEIKPTLTHSNHV